jgi:hypothetical protein
MRDAAAELRRLLESLASEGTSVIDLVCNGRLATPWTLYPDEYGVFDRRTGCQFYYHCHDGAPHEAGHFHTVRFFADHTVHLVAISMVTDGWPQALFTVNLWAIGDRDESAPRLKHYTRQFRVDERRGEPRLVRFVNLLFRAFRSEIEQLQDTKLARLAEYRNAHPDSDPFEDRSLEVLSRVTIDVRARATPAFEEVQRCDRGGTA